MNGSSNSASTSACVQSLRGSAVMRAPSAVSFEIADIRRSLATRLARDAGASQTAARAVNRKEEPWFTASCESLFAESCPACGWPSAGGFCGVCAARVHARPDACRRCGLAAARRAAARARRSRGTSMPSSRRSRTRPPLDHYLHALKYRGARSLGRAFALLLAPAPATRRARRRRARGRAAASRAAARARLQPSARDRAHARPRASGAGARARHRRGAPRRRRRPGRARASGAPAWRGRFASSAISRAGRSRSSTTSSRRAPPSMRSPRSCAPPAQRAASCSPWRGRRSTRLKAGTCSRAGCRRRPRRRARRCSRTRETTARGRVP